MVIYKHPYKENWVVATDSNIEVAIARNKLHNNTGKAKEELAVLIAETKAIVPSGGHVLELDPEFL